MPASETVQLNIWEGPQNGPPLLLLHGVLRCWQDFVSLLPALTTRWHVFGVDFRGHGASTRSPGAYAVIDYVQDALFAIDLVHTKTGKACVAFGHSLGAMVAAAAAAQQPAKVRALVLEDPPFHTMGERLRETAFMSLFQGMQNALRMYNSLDDLARRLADIRVHGPGSTSNSRLGDLRDATSLRFSARCLKEVDPAVLEPILSGRWLDGYELESIAAAISCPTLLLQADPDAGGMLTDDDAERIVARMPTCLRARIPNASHLIHWMQTETTMRLAGAFLESL